MIVGIMNAPLLGMNNKITPLNSLPYANGQMGVYVPQCPSVTTSDYLPQLEEQAIPASNTANTQTRNQVIPTAASMNMNNAAQSVKISACDVASEACICAMGGICDIICIPAYGIVSIAHTCNPDEDTDQQCCYCCEFTRGNLEDCGLIDRNPKQ